MDSLSPSTMADKPSTTDEPFRPDNAAMLLVDYQTGVLQGIQTRDPTTLKNQIVALAETAKLYDLPVILTTADNEGPLGPLLPELEELFPEVEVIDRSVVNAWEDPRVREAVEETGRENLIISGISMEVCVTFPAVSASRDGYNVQAVLDATGAINELGREAALWRMQDAGVTPTTYNGIASELLHDWANEEGNDQAMQFMKHWAPYGYMVESHQNATQ
jgi:nicotinamidase-related amidase